VAVPNDNVNACRTTGSPASRGIADHGARTTSATNGTSKNSTARPAGARTAAGIRSV
jgi:hypothetical protein